MTGRQWLHLVVAGVCLTFAGVYGLVVWTVSGDREEDADTIKPEVSPVCVTYLDGTPVPDDWRLTNGLIRVAPRSAP